MAVKMSRKCIPYTPFRKPLSEATVAFVSMAGIYLASQEPFNLESDATYRVIPGDASTGDLAIAHEHYDHADADADPNIMLPLDRARELAGEGVIAGLNDKHYSLGYVQDLRTVYEQVAPEIATALYQSQTDVVVLTAG
jgi:glycine/betaine/sarcosine/D-proline reductase family selenoprotein B